MKLWHDDIRRAPGKEWLWARTNQEAMEILERENIIEISLDRDLGLHDYDPDLPDADLQAGWDTENDGYTLVEWMLEKHLVPEKITIHSWNFWGAERMKELLEKHGHEVLVKPYARS